MRKAFGVILVIFACVIEIMGVLVLIPLKIIGEFCFYGFSAYLFLRMLVFFGSR